MKNLTSTLSMLGLSVVATSIFSTKAHAEDYAYVCNTSKLGINTSGPAISYKAYPYIVRGDTVVVTGYSGNFAKIIFYGASKTTVGWVPKRFLCYP